METMHKSNCLLCGAALIYQTELRSYNCALCGDLFKSEAVCEQGHFICDLCHSASANELIEAICANSASTKPVELAVSLMRAPSVSMHGPEHHFLVPAVLLSAYYNQKGDVEGKQRKLRVARQRAENVLGGFCGFYGACGAGIGTGIFISLITDSTPLSGESWGMANQMTAESLRCIGALGGPRCCKRDTFLALKSAKRFVKQNLHITLDVPDSISCDFSSMNQECLNEKCPFFSREK